ncbi:hypothetical protein Tco_0149667 [Tanacetum coccineum]
MWDSSTTSKAFLRDQWAWDARDALGYILDCTLKDLASDEELEELMKDQPLSADASPIALSPGYIADSNPEEDKEDPEEDPAGNYLRRMRRFMIMSH